MNIYRPIASNHRTQSFGENRACRKTDGRIVSVNSSGLCPAGTTPFYRSLGMKGHNGEDWATWYREPVFFPVVAKTKWYAKTERDSAGGLGVDVYSVDRIHFGKLPEQAGVQAAKYWRDNGGKMRVKFRFWHGDANAVGENQEVTEGTFIQYADSSGASSGNHLHWSMKFVGDNDETLDKYNGYFGAVDFSDYYENTYILRFLDVRVQALRAIDLARKVLFEAQMWINSMIKK